MSVSVWPHPLYRWYNTHTIYDIISTVYMAEYALYMTFHPRFMTSQHSIHYISLLYLISNWLYLRALPLYLCHHNPDYQSYNPYCTYDNTGKVCITSYEYIWHHIHSWWYHTTVWPSHTLHSCYHNRGYLSSHPLQLSYYLECIEYTKTAICVISNPLYVWHHMNSMWLHNIPLRHHKSVFMTSQTHYPWHHPHCIWHHIHSTCDLTAL